MKIALLGAMACEVDGLRELIADQERCQLGAWELTRGQVRSHTVVLTRSGVGKVLSAAVTQALICSDRPDLIIFTGIAGAIDESLNVGDVIVATDCIQHDMDATALGFRHGEIPYSGICEVSCDSKCRELALSWSPPAGVQVRAGRVLSGDQFIAGNRIHHPHLDDLCGAVVEMEGAAVATIAFWNGIPCCIIRTVSDRANGDSKVHFEDFMGVATMHSVGIVGHLVSRL